MAWVRIHDGAMTHPKLVGLSDKAFRLWVWGLSYAQQHLTDGLLTSDAIPSRVRRAAEDLVAKRLWETHDIGFKIHDYLDWNDSRESVIAKRDAAKNRMQRWSDKRVETGEKKRVTDADLATPLARSGVVNKKEFVGSSEGVQGKPKARSADPRPIFVGQRLTVFGWMLDKCEGILGDHFDAFDLHDWFYALDAATVKSGEVLPDRGTWPWLQARLVAEAQRRGLNIRMATTEAPKTARDYEAETRAQAERVRELLKQQERPA